MHDDINLPSDSYPGNLSKIISLFGERSIFCDIIWSSDCSGKLPGDVDLFVSKTNYTDALQILIEEGFFIHASRSKCDNQLITLSPDNTVLQIHLQSCIKYWDRPIVHYEEIHDGLKCNPLEIEYMYFLTRLASEQISNERYKIKKDYYERQISLTDRNRIKTNLKERGVIFKETTSTKRKVGSFINHFILKLFFKLKRRLFATERKDFFIIFLGVDGAGKSTIIKHLKASLRNQIQVTEHYHGLRESFVWRALQYIKTKRRLNPINTTNAHSKSRLETSPKNQKSSYIISSLYAVEYRLRVLFIAGFRSSYMRLHLCDRSYLDHLLYRPFPFKNWFLIDRSIIVYLRGDPEIINARKPELSVEMIRQQDIQYLALLYGLKYSVIDTTEQTEDIVVEQIKNTVFTQLREHI